jgi:hypothetical protein
MPGYWLHDRILQRSAWIGRKGDVIQVSAWAAQDQQVAQEVSPQGGVSWEVSGVRPGTGATAHWEHFELSGTLGSQAMPGELCGTYRGEGADSRRVDLRWSPSHTQALAWFTEWEDLLEAMEEERLLLDGSGGE